MAAKKGFRAIVLDELNDQQLEEMVLSNWHKLNIALKAGQSEKVLRRLLVCELKRGANARPNVAERIRSALYRAMTKRSRIALTNALLMMRNGVKGDADEGDLAEELQDLGIETIDASDVIHGAASHA